MSLSPLLAEIEVIALNDFGDAETNEVFRHHCPNGLIVPSIPCQGHHAAVDRLYAHVKTEFILHLEDDWSFDRIDFLDECISILNHDAWTSSVCLQHVEDFLSADDVRLLRLEETPILSSHYSLEGLHEQWYGFTFNPHVSRTQTWRALDSFSKHKKERHISRYMRNLGYSVKYLEQGACRHIGWEDSNFPQPEGFLARTERKLKEFFR